LIEFSSGNFPKGIWANLSGYFGIFAVENSFSATIFEENCFWILVFNSLPQV